MFDILTLNNISQAGLRVFDEKYNIVDQCDAPDGIIVRSASMTNFDFSPKTVAVARAGAGVNNIPIAECTKKGIAVFNTPGANANAVKELTVCALFLASRKVCDAYEWCKTLQGDGKNIASIIEKNKSRFAGPEIKGKTLGVIGLGAIGQLVVNAAYELGMQVIGYDPYLKTDVKAELPVDIQYADALSVIYEKSDYITLHLPICAESTGMINEKSISQMKNGVRILNFARGELVESRDMVKSIKSGKVAAYVTDFPTEDMLSLENVTVIPHLGASTPESEDNCARASATLLRDYLEKGNVKNAVNLPDVQLETDGERVAIIHHNVLSVVNDILGAFMMSGIETTGFSSKAKDGIAYTLISAQSIPESVISKLKNTDDVIRVRKISR